MSETESLLAVAEAFNVDPEDAERAAAPAWQSLAWRPAGAQSLGERWLQAGTPFRPAGKAPRPPPPPKVAQRRGR